MLYMNDGQATQLRPYEDHLRRWIQGADLVAELDTGPFTATVSG